MTSTLPDLLLADPTFGLMSPAERRLEALELMKTAGLGDDPLDAALAVEEAEERFARGETPETTAGGSTGLPSGVEPCRDKWGDGCTKPVSATGRCMECGAQRVAPEPVRSEEDKAFDDALLYGNGFMIDGKRVDPAWVRIAAGPEPFPSPPGYRQPPPGFVARFKAATGNNDRQIGDLLGLARSSVQAIVGGRVGENLNPATLETIDGALQLQIAALERLRAEIAG